MFTGTKNYNAIFENLAKFTYAFNFNKLIFFFLGA